jgi:hypothetical protein
MYLIIASAVLQHGAYLILDYSFVDKTLTFNKTFNWTDTNASIVYYMFEGKFNKMKIFIMNSI